MVLIAAFVALVFVYSLLSRRLERTVVTAPILFTVGGMLMALVPAESTELALDRAGFLLIAELGLVMTLFTDAARIAPRMLAGAANLPMRLLSTGMLLTLLLGALCAMVVFGDLSWWEAGILTAILAPTDAGLGQVIVNSPRVPQRIRQALNVEAGLNDGLSVPFLLFFIALAEVEGQGVLGQGILLRFLGEQLGYGLLIGLGVGLAGGWLLALARRREWMAEPRTQLGVVALPFACVLISEASGASMFIAAFVAGLAAQLGFREIGRHSVEFAEDWGQLFDYFIFFLFGVLTASVLMDFTLPIALYAVLSLTLIRMLPVAIALRGTGLSRASVLFIGWFGPRGLASIVLALVYLEEQVHLPGESTIRLAVMATVLLSIFAHGFSALPGIRRYATAVEVLDAGAPEHRAAERGSDAAH
ncbi:MAG: cation:proton antiporter [Betaproteobacteria bacterium]|jgi:NhaP-type Na+/H+ or K+/H+ antiporter|nr:cation:proton antiporter [Betaproteobacteria bacterium]